VFAEAGSGAALRLRVVDGATVRGEPASVAVVGEACELVESALSLAEERVTLLDMSNGSFVGKVTPAHSEREGRASRSADEGDGRRVSWVSSSQDRHLMDAEDGP